jgi:hypothetical protein
MSKKLPPELSGNSVTRTFRLPLEWDTILEYEANYNNISVSSLLNQIVRRYINLQRYRDQNPAISINVKSFMKILQNIPLEGIKESATSNGRKVAIDYLLQRGATFSFSSIKWFIEEIYSRYDRWFNVRYYTKKEYTDFYFNHTYSKQWSIYLKYYFEELFRVVLDLNVEIHVLEDSVYFSIPNTIREDL